MSDQTKGLSDTLVPLVGEFAWHSVTVDPRISAESAAHLAEVERALDEYPPAGDPIRLLEVGAYAHTTGYRLAERRGLDVTLLDVSASTLRLGREVAAPTTATPTLVAADFHELPFEDESFDAVVIRSSVHHTWRWRRVVDQMLRVLNAGGILFLENEPVHRSCCLYLFRVNREEDFTPFEQSLNKQGALRTFAEPYLGSRPETLFGMVENQTIPLDELLDVIGAKADLLETTVVPEHTMGELEHSWVQQMGEPSHKLAACIRADLTRAREGARGVFGLREQRLGFSLPDDEAIATLAERVANELTALPTPSAELEFRVPLAAIFGASTRLVARKRGSRSHDSEARLSDSFPVRDGVVYGFRDKMAALLVDVESEISDIQRDNADAIAEVFPPDSWRLATGGTIQTLRLISQPAPIVLGPSDGDRLLLLRYHCAHTGDGSSTITVRLGGRELHRLESWLSESYLCVARVPASREAQTVVVECHADGDYEDAGMMLHYCGLLPFPHYTAEPSSAGAPRTHFVAS